MKKLSDYLLKHKFSYLFVFVSMVIAVSLDLLTPQVTRIIVDDVIPTVRSALRSRFSRTKNTAQTRGAIRSQVILELENKLAAEIIDSYGDGTGSVDEAEPTVCVVEFSFAVAHGLNQIYLTAHITV